MNNEPEERTCPTPPVAQLVLDGEVLREVLVEALLDPRVLQRLGELGAKHAGSAVGGVPRFMSAAEYAKHVRVSLRTLAYLRGDMTEGLHYSRTGTRIRFHVTEADEFVARARQKKASEPAHANDLKTLARDEVARRRVTTTTKGKAAP